MGNLRLIKTKNIDYRDKYMKLFNLELSKYNNPEDEGNIKKLAYYGVKVVNEIAQDKVNNYQLEYLFEITEVIKTVISLLTPKQLMTIFPIEKRYDGAKYEIKDYFYTMAELEKIGLDNCILNKIDDLLWDYENYEIRRFLVASINILDTMQKERTGKSLLEIWAGKNGVDMYEMHEDKAVNKKYLYNSKTGKSIGIKNISSYLKIVK